MPRVGGGLLGNIGRATAGAAVPGVQAAVMDALKQTPGFNTVAKLPAMLTNAKGKMENLKTTVTTLPDQAVAAVKTAAKEQVEQSLAAQGLEVKNAGTEGNNESEEETNESEEGNNESAEENENQEGGGPRYEIVQLTMPVKDPLYVYYIKKKPVYFTQNKYGKLTILSTASSLHPTTRYSSYTNTKKKRRGVSKKAAKRSVSKLTRKAGKHRSRRS